MDIFNINLDMGLLIIEGIVIFSLIFLMVRELKSKDYKKKREDSLHLETIRKWIEEGDALCRKLLALIEIEGDERKKLLEMENLKSSKDVKIKKVPLPLTLLDRESSLRDQETKIQKMAEAGYDIFEIAQSLGMSPGEVRFSLDWMRYRQFSRK
ncbi:MAG: hypothetical protein QXY90_06260 [Candidatus Anstonellales archaeon]